jgi:hypothetical protein
VCGRWAASTEAASPATDTSMIRKDPNSSGRMALCMSKVRLVVLASYRVRAGHAIISWEEPQFVIAYSSDGSLLVSV